MKRLNLLTALTALALVVGINTSAIAGSGKTVDASKSSVKWTGEKVAGSHYGKISIQSGNLEIENGSITGGEILIDMTSITCDDIENAEYNGKLVGHLKNDDFFSVDKYKTAKLVVTKVIPAGKGQIQIVGKLTIKGITKDIEFMAKQSEKGGSYTATGTMKVDRTKYGIKYSSGSFFENLGDKLIMDEFILEFTIVAS
jgi:polyisoprenoid-binding protein YceI